MAQQGRYGAALNEKNKLPVWVGLGLVRLRELMLIGMLLGFSEFV